MKKKSRNVKVGHTYRATTSMMIKLITILENQDEGVNYSFLRDSLPGGGSKGLRDGLSFLCWLSVVDCTIERGSRVYKISESYKTKWKENPIKRFEEKLQLQEIKQLKSEIKWQNQIDKRNQQKIKSLEVELKDYKKQIQSLKKLNLK